MNIQDNRLKAEQYEESICKLIVDLKRSSNVFPSKIDVRWKMIENYDYLVSDNGQIVNIKTGYNLIPRIDSQGYYAVILTKDKKIKYMRIHRVLANAFLYNPLNKPCIDHIDRDKTNNKLSNLRFCSYSENSMNKSMMKSNTTGITGIYYNKNTLKWSAGVTVNYIHFHLGTYNNIDDAMNARMNGIKKHHMSFANTTAFV